MLVLRVAKSRSRDDALPGGNCRLHLLLPVTRSLLQNLIILIYSDRIFVSLLSSITSLLVLQLLDWLADHLHQVLLEGLLLEDKAVLVPDEVRHFRVPSVLLHASFKQPEHVLVIGVLCELELAAIVHELAELLWMALAQLVHSDFQLLLLDIVVLFVLRSARETLPGETASQEVQQHVPDGLEVITTRLLVPDVSVDTSVSGSSGEVLALAERNVLAVGVLVALGETEIDNVDVIFIGVVASNQEIVRLDVSVNNALLVDFLNALNLFNHIYL